MSEQYRIKRGQKKKSPLKRMEHYVATAKRLGCLNPEAIRTINKEGRVVQMHKTIMHCLNQVKRGNAWDRYYDKHGKLSFPYQHAKREGELSSCRRRLAKFGIEYQEMVEGNVYDQQEKTIESDQAGTGAKQVSHGTLRIRSQSAGRYKPTTGNGEPVSVG